MTDDNEHWIWAGEPPFRGPTINVDGWWGCPDWLIRDEPIRDALWDWSERPPQKMTGFLHDCAVALPGESVEILPARRVLGYSDEDHGGPILHPINRRADRGIAPIYLAYIDAIMRPSEWRWANENLIGVDEDGDMVAVLAPAKVGAWMGA